MIRWIISPFNILLLLVCCGNGAMTDEFKHRPVVEISVVSAGGNSVTLDVKSLNASYTKVLCLPSAEALYITVQDVIERGKESAGRVITIEGLESMTNYTALAVACGKENYSIIHRVEFVTAYADPVPYEWESAATVYSPILIWFCVTVAATIVIHTYGRRSVLLRWWAIPIPRGRNIGCLIVFFFSSRRI